jgi:predicted RNA-binding protein with PUA-like domain
MKYWLFKSEPGTFGIDHLAKAKRQTAAWDGVRNYQARNFIRDEMQKGDQALFYHSSCDVPGVAGVISIVRGAYPDATNPRWYMVDVRLDRKFDRVVALDELRDHAGGKLKDLVVLKRGNRLSITPVTKSEWQFILTLADAQ